MLDAMGRPKIGKLEKVDLRELWRHEERGFSAWLADNLDVLGDAIGTTLNEPHREACAGDFQCDLVVEDEDSNRVIIENQLEATDHDHLGKVITYLTNLEAKTAIWITRSARPEHIKAITWLNETAPDDTSFFLVRLDAYRIAESDPAPLFTVIVAPSPESREFGHQKKDLAERHVLRLQFWQSLLRHAQERGVMHHASRSPGKDMWIAAGAGRSGLSFNYVIWMEDNAAVELYIDTVEREENKRILDALMAQRESIEAAFGEPLEWQRLDQKRACRVRSTISMGGLTGGEAGWPKIQAAMVAKMDRLVKATKPHLARGAS